MEDQRQPRPKDWRDALARLTAIRERQAERHVDVVDLLASVRAERMAELERWWRGEA